MKTIRLLTMSAVLIAASLFFISHASGQNTAKLTDPEIAHVAIVASQIDVDAGELAKTKTKDPEITKFAQAMINDHKAVIAQATDLDKKLGVTPQDNVLSRTLLAHAEETKKSLVAKSGVVFDKAFVDNEIAYHRSLISIVQNTLIPNAENKELKQLLEKELPTLKAHLVHAEMMQKGHAHK
jgi:putative membrane protein